MKKFGFLLLAIVCLLLLAIDAKAIGRHCGKHRGRRGQAQAACSTCSAPAPETIAPVVVPAVPAVPAAPQHHKHASATIVVPATTCANGVCTTSR